VVSLLPEHYQKRKIGPVGRLDRDVTGPVLLTTDGQLAHRLISPKWKAEKTYRAVCEGRLTEADVAAFASGLELSDFTAKPAVMEILSASDEESVADVTLTEGKFHQVKRMFIAVGHPLSSLHRLRIGCVTLDPALAPGEFRALTDEEILGLKRLTNLDKE
jgi:16S rRNA pseudouridine516 synthase